MLSSNMILQHTTRRLASHLLTRQMGAIGTQSSTILRGLSTTIVAEAQPPAFTVQVPFEISKLRSITPSMANKILIELKGVDANFDGRYVI